MLFPPFAHPPFLKDFIYFLERRGGKEKEREGNIDVREKHTSISSLLYAPSGDLAHNPGMCPD